MPLEQPRNQTALFTATTLVVASGAPAAVIAAAHVVKALLGDLVQICNGAADHVEIQAAIANGGKVVLTDGTFTITVAITIEADDVSIEGVGKATKVDLTTVGQNGFVFGDGSTERTRTGISNLTITSSVVKNGGAAIVFNKIRIGTAQNVYIENQYYGIEIEEACIWIDINHFQILDCIATNGVGIYIHSNSGGADTLISQGLISAELGSEPAVGIHLKNVRGLYLDNVTAAFQGTGLLIDPNALRDGENDYISGVYATQCLFDTCSGRCVLINPAAGYTVRNIRLDTCRIGAAASDGLYIGLSGTGTIYGIWLDDCDFLFNGTNGIAINHGINIHIRDCEVADNSVAAANTSDGIVIGAGISEFSIQGTRAGNIYGGGTQRYGIFILTGAGDHIEVTGNDLRGNGTGSMAFGASGTDNIVKDNLGYIAQGEIRTFSKAIVAGAIGTVTTIQNVCGGDALILEAYVSIDTPASATNPTYDMGTDDDGTGAPSDGNNLFDAIPDTAGYYRSTSAGLGGHASGVQVQPVIWTSGGAHDYVNFIIADFAGADTAGRIYLKVMGK